MTAEHTERACIATYAILSAVTRQVPRRDPHGRNRAPCVKDQEEGVVTGFDSALLVVLHDMSVYAVIKGGHSQVLRR